LSASILNLLSGSVKNGAMYELDGAQFEKGKFEIRSVESAAGPLKYLLMLGPIRGRFVVLTILLVSAFATIQRQPGSLFATNGWVSSPEQAAMVQNIFSWGLCVVAVLLWLVFLLFQESSLVLEFNKSKQELRTVEQPRLRQKTQKQGIFLFKDIREIRVFGKDKSPRTPYGYVSIRVADMSGQEESFSFKFLTDEQAKIFPLNIYRMTEKEPVGDWTDPDSEVQA
jgi:hypothetical protein